MKVTETLTFNEYWASAIFFDKRPVRNGSSVMMVGDNIYHRDRGDSRWTQSDSHHSHPDGSPNLLNINKDTSADRVLACREFFYFGKAAPAAPSGLLEELGFQNRIGHRVFDATDCGALLAWIKSHKEAKNRIAADPFDFDQSAKRYTGRGSSIS
jgi:Nucleotide modification associated domain 2